MNIAYLSSDFGVPIFGYKGASVHVREMVTAMARAGHRVAVISPTLEPDEAEAARTDQIEFLPVPLEKRHLEAMSEIKELYDFLGFRIRLRQELRNLVYNLAIYRRVREFLRAFEADVIYERYALFGHAGIRLARLFDVPHILEINAPLAYEQEKLRGLEMKELARESERRVFNQTDRALVVSRSLRDFVVNDCGVDASRVIVLPNAVDPDRFSSNGDAEALRARHALGDRWVVGFVGSLKPWHGTETLLEAFRALRAKHPAAHLLIVGDGVGRTELEQFVHGNDLDADVTFAGKVRYDEIPAYISAMDVTVAPYTPNDLFYYSPIKIFEYMAMAKPVVAGRIGQVEELILDGETGVLFEPGDIDDLERALERLADDRPLCRQLGTRARDWVRKERTWDNNAAQVIATAEELLR